MGIVAPVTGVLAALIPVVAGIVLEGWPATMVLVGIGLALVAVVLVSRVEDEGGGRQGLGLALLAGTTIGLFGVVVDQISDGHVFAPLAIVRGSEALLIVAIILVTRSAWRPTANLLPVLLAIGVLDMAGNAGYIAAVQTGALAIASVVSGLYPVTTVVLAATFLHERVTRSHAVGIVLASRRDRADRRSGAPSAVRLVVRSGASPRPRASPRTTTASSPSAASAPVVDRRPDRGEVAPDHRRVDDPLGPRRVPCQDHGGGQVQHERRDRDAGGAGTDEPGRSRAPLEVRGVEDGQAAGQQPGRQLAMEPLEGGPRDALVGGIAGDPGPERVRGEDLVRVEQARREGRLPGAGRADEEDERRVRELDDRHPAMMPVPSGRRAPDLVPAALGGPQLVRRLVVDGRPADDAAVGEAEPRRVPRALQAPVHDGPLVERPAGVGAHRVHARGPCRRCGPRRGR